MNNSGGTTRFRLLVFDWDGTLMDSVDQIVQCMHAAMADLQEPAVTDNAVKNIIGLGLREAIEALIPGRDLKFNQALVERYRHHWLHGNHRSRLFAGAAETLTDLADSGYTLAVATGKGRRGLDKSLTETGLSGLFAASRCADETSSKPDPRMLHEIMDSLDCRPQDTLMIGDTEYDLEMARNAGVGSVGVTCGVHARERLLRHAPLHVLEDIRGLTSWLNDARACAQTMTGADD